MRREPDVWRAFLRYLPVLVISSLFVFPIFWMVTTSFKNRSDWFQIPPRFFPATPELADEHWYLFAPTMENLNFLLAVSINPLNVVYDEETGEPRLNMATCPFDEAGNRIADPARCEPLLERASQVLPEGQIEVGRFNLFGQHYLIGANHVFIKAIWNSMIVSILSGIFSIIMATLTAYGFSRIHIPRADNLLFWILSLRMLPPVAVIVPFSLIFGALNLTDTQLALVMVYSISNISFGVWVLKGFFDEISREQEEAAAMDGYGPWAIFFKVTLPLVIPGLLTVILFNLIQTTNEFLLAFVLTVREATTGPVALPQFQTAIGVQWSQISAAAALLVVPVVIFTILVRNHLVRGMSFGQLQ
jgi:ABC-type glycerol-3-phosphate transport system permease component